MCPPPPPPKTGRATLVDLLLLGGGMEHFAWWLWGRYGAVVMGPLWGRCYGIIIMGSLLWGRCAVERNGNKEAAVRAVRPYGSPYGPIHPLYPPICTP